MSIVEVDGLSAADLQTLSQLPTVKNILGIVKLVAGNFPSGFQAEAITVDQLIEVFKSVVQTPVDNLADTAYPTLAEALTHIDDLSSGKLVLITNDGANNGLYLSDGTTLNKTEYDAIVLSDVFKDIKTIMDVVNGEANTKAISRLGRDYWTLATIDALIADGLLKIDDLQDAIDIAAAAGAGANGWTASLVVDASGKTQQEINDSILDPILKVPSAPMIRTYDEWNQKDWNDSVVDVRKFIKKNMSNVTTGLQAAIEAAYGQTLLIPIPLKPLDTIYVNQGLNIVGTRRSTKNYATDVPALDFRSLGAGKHAIYVAESASVIGFGMSDFTIFGNRNGGTGIKMGTDITKNMSDFSIENILLYNFTTAMEKSFVWDGLFKNLRVQSCVNGIKYSSQANALLYSQCRIVSIDDMALQFINAEGVQFDACDISNLTKTNGTPITLYQSCVTMNTPYLENISNSDSGITVGSVGEVIGSTLLINNPLKLGKNIKIGGPKGYVEINGQDRNQTSVVGVSINIETNAKVTKRLRVAANRKLSWWTAKQPPVFQSYGGTPTVTPNRDFANINSASAAVGITLAANLEVGKVYTLRLAFRKGADFTAISMRHGAVNLGINIDEAGVAPTTRTYSFIATSTALSVTWGGNLEVFGFDIMDGNLNEQDLDPYNLSDFTRTVTIIRNAIPTVGTWRAGDRVENSAPTTYAGWVCTVAGTPGTWKQYGAIV